MWFSGRHFNQKANIIIDWFVTPEQTKQTAFLYFQGWINKLTLKDNTILYFLNLFIFCRPYHLPSFKQCSRDPIFHWQQLVYSVMEKKKNLCYHFISIINIIILSLNFYRTVHIMGTWLKYIVYFQMFLISTSKNKTNKKTKKQKQNKKTPL